MGTHKVIRSYALAFHLFLDAALVFPPTVIPPFAAKIYHGLPTCTSRRIIYLSRGNAE
uniref:Uncharacterized protein n=1 Tax=Siphoviridae sp. ctzyE57 TaxID=2827982 RepID=A0A8S5SGH9_9CAUD|nr:MAG TPA: hypothetical protein [Siphoviridae sp. ctzyE57]